MEQFLFKYLAPIPIGHVVRLYRKERAYLDTWISAGFAELIYDVDSGTVYGSDEEISKLRPAPGEPVALAGGVQYLLRLEGRVVFCMVHSCGGDTAVVGTTMGIEPSPAAPYR
jgi:hypothetical protein